MTWTDPIAESGRTYLRLPPRLITSDDEGRNE